MKDEEINVAIAEHCGWRNVRELDDLHPDGSVAAGIWWQGVDPTDSQERAILDYAGDLNAMHEAEEFLPENKWAPYRDELRNAVLGPVRTVHEWCKADLHPTARQRAEAFLRTIGKWKEEA